METGKQKPNLNVVVSVKAVNYQNGNVMESKGKITKIGDSNSINTDEDSLSFKGSDCGKSQMEVNYNSSSNGSGEQTTEVELQIKGSIINDKKGLTEVIETDAKLSKTNIGEINGPRNEDWLNLKIENSCDAKCASTESFYTHKNVELKA